MQGQNPSPAGGPRQGVCQLQAGGWHRESTLHCTDVSVFVHVLFLSLPDGLRVLRHPGVCTARVSEAPPVPWDAEAMPTEAGDQ